MKSETKHITSSFPADRRIFERLAELGKEPKVVYDIGASTGSWSAAVSAGFPEVEHHLFEPLANIRDYSLLLQLELAERPKWTLHRMAVCDHNGVAKMNIPISDHPMDYMRMVSSTIVDVSHAAALYDQLEVPCCRLDDYCAEKGIPAPTVIKMDAQGSELNILRGGQKAVAAAEILIVEGYLYRPYGPLASLLSEVIEFVTPLGFVVCELGDIYRTKGQIIHVDAVFAKAELAALLYP